MKIDFLTEKIPVIPSDRREGNKVASNFSPSSLFFVTSSRIPYFIHLSILKYNKRAPKSAFTYSLNFSLHIVCLRTFLATVVSCALLFDPRTAMMTRSYLFFALVSHVLLTSTCGFSATSVKKPFGGGSSAAMASLTVIDEEVATLLLNKARECAFSDSCSVEESEEHLRDMLHIQGACASGTVLGHDICDNQQAAAEVVARLRKNIEMGRHGLR